MKGYKDANFLILGILVKNILNFLLLFVRIFYGEFSFDFIYRVQAPESVVDIVFYFFIKLYKKMFGFNLFIAVVSLLELQMNKIFKHFMANFHSRMIVKILLILYCYLLKQKSCRINIIDDQKIDE
jgi:hypothetical protein